MQVAQLKSLQTGFCTWCRKSLIVACIPEEQHKRYLIRIGAYERYKEKRV
jgi:hypothetical protein